jgi:protocatechuate 3,4-dioxygenase beta subunit
MRFRARDWDSQPPFVYPAYKSTVLRGPTKPLIPIAHSLSELTGPVFDRHSLDPLDHDLTRNAARHGEALGERIIVTGRVTEDGGRPVAGTLVEIWQTNSAGRYIHASDRHDAPLDPNFFGAGRCLTDEQGSYRFLSVKPGAYPWGNHDNAWRPAHIHFSLFGPSFATRLVTQMYFPGDPLLELDPVFLATPTAARDRLVSRFALDVTEPGFALGYVFDIVLRGREATPREGER